MVPELDAKQDKTLLWAKQAGGVTTFAFTMPVHNCGDVDQDVSLTEDRFTHVIYAYGLPNAKVCAYSQICCTGHSACMNPCSYANAHGGWCCDVSAAMVNRRVALATTARTTAAPPRFPSFYPTPPSCPA